jgi:hypothetical protein
MYRKLHFDYQQTTNLNISSPVVSDSRREKIAISTICDDTLTGTKLFERKTFEALRHIH